MSPAIENPTQLTVPPAIKDVLKIMFAEYRRIILIEKSLKQHTKGRIIEFMKK